MIVDWESIRIGLFPIKNYEDLCKRLSESFSYPFVQQKFNLSMPELLQYTRLGIGGDPKLRYDAYVAMLVDTITRLQMAGIENILDLFTRVASRPKLEDFTQQSAIQAEDTVDLLKYIIYWVVPMKKPLSGLVKKDTELSAAMQKLSGLRVKTNLELLQQGLTAEDRQTLAQASGLPESVVLQLVNRADFSRLPWSSKATISNIIGAGYASLAELVNADPQKLTADTFRYGESIGKNLKIGNEIENSYRIAKIAPRIIQ
jgi:hypothetical protein